MNILHIIHNYYPSIGGSQLLFQRVSEELVRSFNDQVTVYTTNAMYSPHASSNKFLPLGIEMLNGVEVHRYPFTRLGSRTYRNILRVRAKVGLPIPFRRFFDLLNAGPISMQMCKAIYDSNADLVVSTPVSYLNSYYPIIAKHLGKSKPFVIYGALHLHNNPINKTYLWAIKQADAYIAYTSFERDYLVQKGINPDKIHVFGIGVDIEGLSLANGNKIREKYNLGKAPLVLFLGRQASYKGIDTLIQAMRLVWRACPDAYLMIAGSVTPFTESLQHMIDELSPQEQSQIRLLGSVEESEKADFYSAGDIFVTVSSQESFGIVYLEAWANKKPVIGGKIGAVQSVIREGVDGMLVEIGNAADLSDALVHLISHPEIRQSMGNEGYSRVIQDYTWETVTRKLRSVYEKVLSGAPN